jgi:hypothetical protein
MDGGQGREAKAATPSIQGGREPGSGGKVNAREALLNVVTKDKPQMLSPGERLGRVRRGAVPG